MNSKRLRSPFKCMALALIAFVGLIQPQVYAKELVLLVPSQDDASTRDFLDAISTNRAVRDAGITFRFLRSDPAAPPDQAGSLLLEGKVPLALLRAQQIPGYATDIETLRVTSLLSHPLAVKDLKEQFLIEDSVLGDAVKMELGSKGFVVLSFWNTIPSSLIVRTPVKSIADLKGLKLRVPEQQSGDVLRALGATPVELRFAELEQALESGVIDGSEIRVARDSSQLAPVKGGSLLAGFQYTQGFLVAHQASWIALRQRERVAIQTAASEAMDRARATVLEVETELPQVAKANGLSFTTLAAAGASTETARSLWLKRTGDEGRAALGLLDEVKRLQSSQPILPTPSSPRSGSALPSRIFFATNRNDEGDDAELSYRFGVARSSSSLSCGEVDYVPDVHRNFGTAHRGPISLVGSRIVNDAPSCVGLVGQAARENGNGDLVVFVHGFWNSFDSAVRRAIAFALDFDLSAPIVVFAWPSMDQGSAYIYDTDSVWFTRPFIRQFMGALVNEQGLSNVSLLAHSMGSAIALDALEFVAASGKGIRSVVFVAPDVARSNFIQGIRLYGGSAELATLYANEHDRALWLSMHRKLEAPAGLGGPSRLTLNGVETIDVSQVDRQLLEVNHSYGFDVSEVANDVSHVLRQHRRASMRSLPSAVQNGMTYWMIRPQPTAGGLSPLATDGDAGR